jgi:signal transduction histidine kinase
MSLLHRLRLNISFRSQLLVAVSLGVICLAVIASLATAWMSSKQARALLVAQGLQITSHLAWERESVLALLYVSDENAKELVAAMLSFPDVRYVAIVDRDDRLLLVEGDPKVWGQPTGAELGVQRATLVAETLDTMYFVAPVYTHDELTSDTGSPFTAVTPTREFLGYVRVALGKSTLHSIQASIFANNIVVSLLVALFLLILLNLLVSRMIRPLMDLARVMKVAETEESHVHAYVQGPVEVAYMAQVFNRMMAALEERDRQLRQQNDVLETEVNLRTQELVHARDAALTASRHKSEFLANMSHELRTPMNAIIGYTEMVIGELELEGRGEIISDLKRVVAAAHHLLTLINNILDLAKIEAGRTDVHLEVSSIRGLVDHAVDTIQPMMLKNRNRLTVEVDANPDRIEMDAGKLTQILLNLLSNAAKFTQDGQVTLKVTCSEEHLAIQVTDTGIGIAREQQAYIFDEFRQLDMSPTRNYEGTGLGLAITRRFCDLLGGRIAVESECGQGSTFTVQIPLPMAREIALPRPEPLEVQGIHNSRPALPSDDDKTFLDILALARTPEQDGDSVVTAADSKEVLLRARGAMTLDLKLANTDGWSIPDTDDFKHDPMLRG